MTNEESSKRIKSIAIALNLKVQDFAIETGIHKEQMYAYTSGKSIPAWHSLDKILSRFPKVSAEYLMRGKGEVLIE